MGNIVKGIVGAVLTVVGFVTGNPYLIATGASMVFSTVLSALTPSTASNTTNAATTTRLSKSLMPEDFRKIVLGHTAVATDTRYWEVYGSDGNTYVEVLAAATHPIHSFGDFYADDKLAVSGDVVQTDFVGAMSPPAYVLEGTSGGGITLGQHGKWGSAQSMTGCAYYAIEWFKNQDVLPSGVPSRYTQIGEGAPVYDPRRDVSFGGSHDIYDQGTWEYAPTDSNGVPIGRNNALQMLWYLLGWRINDVVVAGRAVDPVDINIDDFIVAANACEAYHWYSDMCLSTGDTHSTNESIIAAASGGKLLDTGGRFSFHPAYDDTASVAQQFDEGDIVSGITWTPKKPMDAQFNEVTGTFIDPSATALYQPRTYGVVTDATYTAADGFKRRTTLNLQSVQDITQAQKLARIQLNMAREQGVFVATFSYKALRVKNWDVVQLSFSRYGWVNKLFRVTQQEIAPMGGITLTLAEEDPQFYGNGTVVLPDSPGIGSGNDQTRRIPVQDFQGIDISVLDATGLMTLDGARVSWTRPSQLVARTDVMYQPMVGDGSWNFAGSVARTAVDDATGTDKLEVYPLLPETAYNFRARHVSVYGVPGPWATTIVTTDSTTSMDASLIRIANQTVKQAIEDSQAGQAVLQDFANKLAELSISSSVRVQDLRDYLEVLGYQDGQPLGTVITRNEQQQIDGDNLLAQVISYIGAMSSDGAAFILNTLTTKVSPTLTLADAFTQLSAATSTLRTDFTNQITVQASTDATWGSYFTLLGAAGTGANAGTYILNSGTVKTTYDGQTLGTTLAGMQSSIGTNAANIVTEGNTRASGDSANATSISTVSSTVSGHTASITSINSSINGINARASVTLDVNGYVSGWYLASTGATSSFTVLTSNFNIVDPGHGAGPFTPFSYSSGLFKMTNIEVDTIKANTITTNHLVGGAVTSVALGSADPFASFSSTGQVGVLGFWFTNQAGGPCEIINQLLVDNPNSNDNECDVWVYRNGSQIDSLPFPLRQNFTVPVSWTTFDSPGVGTHYYEVYVSTPNGHTLTCQRVRSRALEFKR